MELNLELVDGLALKPIVKMKDMESCVQYSVANINVNQESDGYVCRFKNYAPGGYLWIFPKGDRLC